MTPRVLLSFLLVFFTPLAARAQAPAARDEQCFSAYEQTQVLLRSGDLKNAGLSAEACSTGCPEEINVECKAWVDQVKRDMPSVILLARSPRGIDAEEISLQVDGLSTEPLNSDEPISLNPGPHTLTLTRDDGWKEAVGIVVHKGEQLRQIRVTVPDRNTRHFEVEPSGKQSSVKGWTIASFTLSGLGFAAAATGGIVALGIKGKLSDCDNVCSAERIDSLERQGKNWLLVGDIGLIVGGVGAVSGVALLIWGTSSGKSPSSAQLNLIPTVGGGAGVVTGTF
jgi:hypothetical protein